jgi:hypothetical protein
METTYINTFFELDINIIGENKYYFNNILFNNKFDFVKYLKKESNTYAEYILKEAAKLNTENKKLYLQQKITRLKSHSSSLDRIYEDIINHDKLTIITPFASIQLKINSKNIDKAIQLFNNIFLQVKTISLKVVFDIGNQIIDNTPPQPESETEQETPTFTNNFDKINPTEIHKHFKAGLVEKRYLTEQELNEFLKVAFELKTTPETLFKIKDAPNKATIEAVFYKYYKNVAGKIHCKQNQYSALLWDYFEGYKTATVSSNFSKSVY